MPRHWSGLCPPRRDMVILEKNCRRSTAGRSISASPARRKISCRRPYRRSLRRNPEEISNCNMPVITRDKPGRGAVPPPPVLPGDGGRDGSAGEYSGAGLEQLYDRAVARSHSQESASGDEGVACAEWSAGFGFHRRSACRVASTRSRGCLSAIDASEFVLLCSDRPSLC